MRAVEFKSKAGGRRATLKEVAEELGVAPSTVSNAYNRPDQLSVALRERVFETARRLGYPGPDPLARGLRRRRAGAVGVLYDNRLSYAFGDPAEVLFLQGVSMVTEEEGLGLLLLSGAPGEERHPEVITGAVVDGFVLYSMSEGDPLVDAALGRRLPTVLVDQPQLSGLPVVSIDDEAAARSAAEHLIQLGHRRLGIVSFGFGPGVRDGIADLSRQEGATYRVSRSRLRGYAAAITAAGLPGADVPVYECAENVPEKGRIATEALLSRDPRPTAILTFSDQLALGAIEAARRLGLSVPKDLSVVGFDDVPEAARATPPLTTVHQPHIDKGLLASQNLLARLRDEEPSSLELLPTHLIVRGSAARPKTRH
jgi:DNA-binding LacI/PurR family transcriptional regulator